MEESKKIIMIIANDKTMLFALSEIIKDFYAPNCYHDADIAIGDILSLNPSLILIYTDIVSGSDIIMQIKKNKEICNIPIIMLTSKRSVIEEERFFRLGADDYISKPFRRDVVISRINHQMRLMELIQQLEKVALIDQLTGIYNRRYLEENLSRITKSLSRSSGILSVIMLDIDFFKKYNDTYGHDGGDICLKLVAEGLSKTMVREGDFVARYGGEEFAVILPNTDESGAHVVADKLLENIRALNIPHKQNDAAHCVTVSLGVTTGKVSHKQSGENYIKRADEALYMSKQSGRNRYTFLSFEKEAELVAVKNNNWILLNKRDYEQQYMQPLFDFIFGMFVKIFGDEIMYSEKCIVCNDPSEYTPMFITDTIPIKIRTNAKNLNHWVQFIYNLSHELSHYAIRQQKKNKDAIIKWFEETICESMSMYILHLAANHWNECKLYNENPQYAQCITKYYTDIYDRTANSVLKTCVSYQDLQNIENTCEKNRDDRSVERNHLFDTFVSMPDDIRNIIYYTQYIQLNGLQIDFNSWEADSKVNERFIFQLSSIQPILGA